MAGTFALSASLQDVTAKGPRRVFNLIGSADCVVVFETGFALNSSSFGRVKDPASPSADLTLRGPAASSVQLVEPSSFLRYKVLSGTVTSCWIDSAQEPAAGPAGTPAPRLNPTATKTGAYTAAAFDLVRCDPTGGAFSVTLPAAASVTAGTPATVKNATSSTTAITIAKSGSDTIDGASSGTINTARGVKNYVSDGVSDWIGV